MEMNTINTWTKQTTDRGNPEKDNVAQGLTFALTVNAFQTSLVIYCHCLPSFPGLASGSPRKWKSCSDNKYPESLEFISKQVSSPIHAQQSTISILNDRKMGSSHEKLLASNFFPFMIKRPTLSFPRQTMPNFQKSPKFQKSQIFKNRQIFEKLVLRSPGLFGCFRPLFNLFCSNFH